jgi:hypothetical protein
MATLKILAAPAGDTAEHEAREPKEKIATPEKARKLDYGGPKARFFWPLSESTNRAA